MSKVFQILINLEALRTSGSCASLEIRRSQVPDHWLNFILVVAGSTSQLAAALVNSQSNGLPPTRDWSKSIGGRVGRSNWKFGKEKIHDPPLTFGTKLFDPPLNEG